MRIDFNFEPLTEQELRDAPRPEPEEIKEPIVPVPADAPPLAFKHPEFGVPVKLWPYLDAQSNLLGYMGRFNDEDGNKHYYPLTYCRMGHETAWRAHGFPAPYPLYNLPDLISCPDKQVLIVRGEANVDAAKLLFPYLVAVSAPYDDGLFSSADWSPLQGRHIIVFPHHDDREDSFISKVTSLVYRSGASSVRILRPESIAKICWRDGSKFSRPLIPESWDAAKAIEDGWTAEELAKHIGDFQNLRLQPKPLVYDRFRKPSFQMAQDGVEALHVVKDNSGNITVHKTWICGPMELIAQSRTDDCENWGKRFKLINADGLTVDVDIPMKNLASDGASIREHLLNLGLKLGTTKAERELLMKYIADTEISTRIRDVESVGWHDGVYVSANGVIGQHPSGEKVRFAGQSASNVCAIGGSAEIWRQNLTRWAIGNSRLVFAISAAFSAPLLKLTTGESGGFHFVGGSSIGKTTVLHVAGSVFGGGGIQGYLKSWRTTDNAAEAIAAAHCDALLCLDEIGQATGKVVGAAAYMLANGEGKSRMTKAIAIRKALTWRTVVLSTGEVSLETKIRENDTAKFPMAGQAVRFVDIPADAGAGMGLFENLHGFETPGQFARALQASAMMNYGHAANEFIEFLVEDVEEKAIQVMSLAEDFITILGLSAYADGQVLRVANKFALVAAAGELAIEAGVVLWPRGEAFKSVGKVFHDWLKEREGTDPLEDIQAIEHVRYFIQKHQVTRFERDIDNEGKFPEPVRESLGFIIDEELGSDQSERLYCFYGSSWKHDVCHGRNPKSVASALLARGLLVTKDNRLTITKRNKGRTYRVYAVRESILLEPETKLGSHLTS